MQLTLHCGKTEVHRSVTSQVHINLMTIARTQESRSRTSTLKFHRFEYSTWNMRRMFITPSIPRLTLNNNNKKRGNLWIRWLISRRQQTSAQDANFFSLSMRTCSRWKFTWGKWGCLLFCLLAATREPERNWESVGCLLVHLFSTWTESLKGKAGEKQQQPPLLWDSECAALHLELNSVLPTNFHGKLLKEGWFVAKWCCDVCTMTTLRNHSAKLSLHRI